MPPTQKSLHLVKQNMKEHLKVLELAFNDTAYNLGS